MMATLAFCMTLTFSFLPQAFAMDDQDVYIFKIQSDSSGATIRTTKNQSTSGSLWDENKVGEATCKVSTDFSETEIKTSLREGFSASVFVMTESENQITAVVHLSQSKFDVKEVTQISPDCSVITGAMETQTFHGIIKLPLGKPQMVKFKNGQVAVVSVTKSAFQANDQNL